ncbi:MAG: hypothetical protein WAM79_08520 [Candidatus Sulfotelmatobacter sp.]
MTILLDSAFKRADRNVHPVQSMLKGIDLRENGSIYWRKIAIPLIFGCEVTG